MIIETFKPGKTEEAYRRFYKKGRMLPDGLDYQDSWLEGNGQRCFQLMETDNEPLLEQWMKKWNDIVDFEIVTLGEKPRE